MAKPSVTTIAVKEAPLTYAELDANFTNLRDATLTVSDGVNSTPIDLNGTITFAGGDNVTVTENNGVITIDSTASGGGGAIEIVNVNLTSTAAVTVIPTSSRVFYNVTKASGLADPNFQLLIDVKNVPVNTPISIYVKTAATSSNIAVRYNNVGNEVLNLTTANWFINFTVYDQDDGLVTVYGVGERGDDGAGNSIFIPNANKI